MMRLVAAFAAVWLSGLLAGCGSTGFDEQRLAPPGFPRGTRGAMDGFVFVPARAVNETAIPNATVKVYEVRGQGQSDILLGTTQANADGFYHLPNQPLGRLLRVEAVDPFQIPNRKPRRVAGMIAFNVAEERTRNLNPSSTLAAAVIGVKGETAPLSENQISDLEAMAERRLAQPGAPDITADPDALLQLANEMAEPNYGTADIFVYAQSGVAATVMVNGKRVGTVQTLAPGSAPGNNYLHLDKLARGLISIRVEAPGFLPEVALLDIVPGENAQATITLLPKPPVTENERPRIIDTRAVPARLPSTGGRVILQALIFDPEDDDMTVTAEIRPPAPTPGAPRPAPVTLTLTAIGRYLFVGTFDAPANQHQGNATYSVELSAKDASHPPTKANFTFQVAGLRS